MANDLTSGCCGGSPPSGGTAGRACEPSRGANDHSSSSCCSHASFKPAEWITGSVRTSVGTIPLVSTELSNKENWEHLKCRLGGFRHRYQVEPGLYAVGNPDDSSDVLVSANYKLSFDAVRRELTGMSAWILVLDTKGINVWCAAAKGTFGTDELANRIKVGQLDKIVKHKRIIVPQLGAVGVSAYRIAQMTGFRVAFGPVHMKDVREYIASGYKTDSAMRTIEFPMKDRLILIPMEIHQILGKYLAYSLAMLLVFGLKPSGLLFADMIRDGLPFIVLGFVSILAGAILTPLFLPYIPSRSFAIKGWIMGLLVTVPVLTMMSAVDRSALLKASALVFFPMASSFLALQFTGATPFTSPSGVNRELRTGLPIYLLLTGISAVLLIVYKCLHWRL
jgi:hypothetical protein